MVSAGDGPLGILAGNGALPLEVADEVSRNGRPVHIVAIAGEAEPGIERHPHTWVGLGQIGGLLRAFRGAGCRDIVILGGVRRPDLKRLRADLGFVINLPLILSLMAGGDDSVLRKIVSFFERRGFRVVGAHDVAPGLLAKDGPLGNRKPDDRVSRHIALGFALVEALGPLDVGQGVVIAGGRPVAIEAAEGTDRMLMRLESLRASGITSGGVLVKAPKPGQELRIDLPAVGPKTVELASAAGLAGIAVAAGQVLVAERDRLAQRLAETGLFLIGSRTKLPDSVPANDEAAAASRWGRLRWITGKVRSRDIRDAERALQAISSARPFGAGAAAVSVREHVLALEAGEGAEAMLGRVAGLRQWGDRLSGHRRGVAALQPVDADPAHLVQLADTAGLAGLVMAGAWTGRAHLELLAAASRRRLFVLACEDSG